MAGYIDLFMDQNATFNTAISLTDVNGNPLNLVHYLVVSEMKKSYITANVAATFTVSFANTAGGIINLILPYQTTQNLRPQRYVFDVIVRNTTTNVATRLIEGTVYVNAGVSPSP